MSKKDKRKVGAAEVYERYKIKGDIVDGREVVIITKQHAYSLSVMVVWFKKFIKTENMPASELRSNELTAGYCDELLKDLNN